MGIFSDFVVTIWMSWVAVILALISTCTIFPDFIAGGSIDVVLSKPISRVMTLFGMKYSDEPPVRRAPGRPVLRGHLLLRRAASRRVELDDLRRHPVVTVFFSYLYGVCVLAGVLTRSAITALLLTLLFWFSLWGMQTAEGTLFQFRTRFEIQAENSQTRIDRMEKRLDEFKPDPEDAGGLIVRADLQRRLEQEQGERDTALNAAGSLGTWHGPTRVMMTVLPKTQLTVGLLSRWLKDPDGFGITGMMRGDMTGAGTSSLMPDPVDVEMTRRLEDSMDSYSSWYIIGTSLGFEALVLVAACLIFVRRDF